MVDNSLFECNTSMDLKTLRKVYTGLHMMKACTTGQMHKLPFTPILRSPHVEWINMLYDRIT